MPDSCKSLEIKTRQNTTSKNTVAAIYSQKSASVASVKREGLASLGYEAQYKIGLGTNYYGKENYITGESAAPFTIMAAEVPTTGNN